MPFAQRGTQYGHGVGEPVLMGDDAVGIALHHQGSATLAHRVASNVQPVEQIAFGEQRRLGRVDVFGRAGRTTLGQHTSADAHRATLRVADRKQHATSEPVVELAPILRSRHQTDRFENLRTFGRPLHLSHKPIALIR